MNNEVWALVWDVPREHHGIRAADLELVQIPPMGVAWEIVNFSVHEGTLRLESSDGDSTYYGPGQWHSLRVVPK